MMYYVPFWLCIYVLYARTGAYNVEINKVGKVYGNVGAQFGYSLAFVDSRPLATGGFVSKFLLVGSPNMTVDGIRAHGDVYKCEFADTETPTCQQMMIKDPKNNCQYFKRDLPTRSDCEEDSRMGATVIVNREYKNIHHLNIDRPDPIPLVTMCAPGWKRVLLEDNDTFEKYMFGMCLKLNENFQTVTCPSLDTYSYCWPFWGSTEYGREITWNGSAVFAYAIGGLAADFSNTLMRHLLQELSHLDLHYLQDGLTEVIGGPGVNRNRGAFRAFHKKWMVKKPFPDKLKGISGTESTTYYGYAIASGKFANGANLVVGNPNFHTKKYGHRGQVEMLYGESKIIGLEFQQRSTMKWCESLVHTVGKLFDISEVKSQVGLKYGAAVAAVDITGDNYDDVFVGAPLYSDQNVETGIVFVYQANENGNPCLIGILSGASKIYALREEANFGRFGTTISKAGDLDLDGYDDVAIGAPYESGGSGAVYIYSGIGPCKCLMPDEYSQRIEGKVIHPGIQSFGWSIYGSYNDVDDNGFADLAVGAYASDMALVFRSRPVSHVSVHMAISPKPIPLVATNLSCSRDKVALCMNLEVKIIYEVDTGKDIRNIGMRLHLDADTLYKKKQNGQSRIVFRSNTKSKFNETFVLIKGQTVSKSFILDVPLGETGRPEPRDPWTTVQVKGFFELIPKDSTEFSELEHILAASVKRNVSTEADFDKKCDNINECTSDLDLKVDLYLIGGGNSEKVDNKTAIIVDDKKQMEMTIDVTNLLNTSYRTNVSADVQAVLHRRVSQDGAIQAECKDELFKMPTKLNCTAEEELDKNENVRLKSNFDISRARLVPNMDTLENMQEFVNVSVIANQGNADVNMKNNVFNICIPVLIKSEIDISVDTRTSNEVRYNADPKSERTIKVQHRYYVTNKGPSFLPKTYVNISIPHKRDGETISYVKSNPLCIKRGSEAQILTTEPPTKATRKGITIPEPEKQRKRREVEEAKPKEADASTEKIETTQKTRNITCGEYECVIYECKLEEMEKSDTTTIELDITVAEKEIARMDGVDEVHFITNASATPPTVWFSGKVVPWDFSATESKTTIFTVKADSRVTKVNIWIIIGSVIGALLILVIIIIVLWKVGFLKRDKKQQLQRMKQESLYKRRSMRASTMSGTKMNTPNIQIE